MQKPKQHILGALPWLLIFIVAWVINGSFITAFLIAWLAYLF